MKNIAITGANGLVGSRVVELLNNNFHFLPINHQELDITKKHDVQKYLKGLDFDLLLHLAAYTQVDKAEEEKQLAEAINVSGTKHLFEAVKEHGKKMIYISTDFVFNGKKPPYDESSHPQPIGYYAQTKWEGEKTLNNQAMIVRTSYPYGKSKAAKPDFVQRIRQLLVADQPLQMMTDAIMTPTYIDDIVYGLQYLMNHWAPKVYHLVGSQSYSPYAVGEMIAEHYDLPRWLVQPTTFAQYVKGKAPRPQYLEIKSITNDFQQMHAFGEMLEYL